MILAQWSGHILAHLGAKNHPTALHFLRSPHPEWAPKFHTLF